MAKTSTSTKRGRPPMIPVNSNREPVFEFQSIRDWRINLFSIENDGKENSVTKRIFYGDKGFDSDTYDIDKTFDYDFLIMWNKGGDKRIVINDKGIITV